MKKFKKYIYAFLLIELFFSYAPVYAQTVKNDITYDYAQCQGNSCKNPISTQIEQYLCAPTAVITSQTSNTNTMFTGMDKTQQEAAAKNANAGDLYKCINQLYKFAIVIASVVGVFFIVIAGYIYMSSNGEQESVTKAKDIMTSTITALVILLAGYVLLKAINPDLIQFQPIQPPSVVPTTTLTSSTTVGGTTAQQFAQQISNNGSNIILASLHSSGISDNANAKQNIVDTAAGRQASRSNYQGAPGGTVALNAKMLSALMTIGNQYRIEVSEIAGGSHSSENANPNSPNGHYGGNAFDITSVNGSRLAPGSPMIQTLMTLCKNLGATQTIDETASANHVHCGAF